MSQHGVSAQPAREASVAAAFPLALLQSVRAHDHPGEVLEDEDLTVSLPRRLGLTDVIWTQMKRYEAAQRSGQAVRLDEVLSLIRLVMRRPDAEPILRETGKRIARWRFGRVPAYYLSLLHRAPNRLGTGAARRHARQTLRQLRLGARVDVAKPFAVRLIDPAAVFAEADSSGCGMITAFLEEQLLLFTGHERAIVHEACASHGGNVCVWRMT